MAVCLVVTASVDPTADYLIQAMRKHEMTVHRFVIDENHYPIINLEVGTNIKKSTISTSEGAVNLRDIGSVVFRKPQAPRFRNSPVGEERFLAREILGGVRAALEHTNAFWINHPSSIAKADCKALNLSIAQNLGLVIPHTLISSSQSEVAAWLERQKHRRYVMKAVTHGLIESDDKTEMVFAEPLPASFDAMRDMDVAIPIMIQERVEKELDIRVNVIGTEMFASALKADATTPDWRKLNDGGGWRPIAIPADVKGAVLSLCGRLGLPFAALDFAVAGEQWYFLELNPNGQWVWIQEATGQDLSGAFCRLLKEMQ